MQLPFYSSLDEVCDAARDCMACGRSSQRTQVVPGSGNPNANLMLVGEYPSQSDDVTGAPFTGPAGDYLDQLLAAAGTTRDEVYITNIVRCYSTESGATGGRIKRATKREREACAVWMDLETQFVDPRYILALGAPAAGSLIGEDFRLTEEHGTWRSRPDGRWITATMQPAYILRVCPHDPGRADELHDLLLSDIRAAVELSRSTSPE
ncbi:MAG: uracil-DNA glycosylase [Thermomicrobiaceae bacterium]